MKFEIGRLFYDPDEYAIVKIKKVEHVMIYVVVVWKYHDEAEGQEYGGDVQSSWSEGLIPAEQAKSRIMAEIFEWK
jgi:hypothetical protein